MLANVADISQRLDCVEELAGVEDILTRGPSYLRQRAIYQKTGRLEPVIDALIEEWRTNERVESA